MKPRRRKKAAIIVPVVSMGDIAFLLIIFFMLCSHFAKEAGQNITPARSEDIDNLKKAPIFVAIDEKGVVYFQGAATGGADEVEALLSEVIDEDTPAERRRVHLKVDASVEPEVYKPVLEALGKAGASIELVGEKGPRQE